MRVLVTGHLGYLGPAVVGRLLDAGHDVVGLDSGLFAGCALEADRALPWMRRDVRDVSAADLRGFEAIVHLAALSNDPLGSVDPALTHEVNAAATVRLARLAREAGVDRFVFSSSCSVNGATTEEWVDETTPPNPVTPYGESKLAAEAGLATLASPSFTVVSLRNATAFGYSPRLRTDLVVNDLAAGAFLRREIRLNSDGSAWRPLVHVQDIARAFSVALIAPAEAVNGAVVNVGADTQNYTVMEIARAVATAAPEAQLSVAAGAGADKRSYRVRFHRVQRALPGFACQFDLKAGIEDLIAHLARVGLRSTEGCVRLSHLRLLQDAGQVDASLRFRQLAPVAV
jgi:nucleoside-diphosphate-sugar epimerase